jgi:hypothetical protein
LIDIWGLVGFHSSIQKDIAQKAETIFKKKVAAGWFTKDLLHLAIVNHTKSLQSHFKNIVQLSGGLFMTSNAHSRNIGALLFRLLFQKISSNQSTDSSYSQLDQVE